MTPHEKTAEAVALRTLGLSLAAISERTGIAVRTLGDIFKRHGTKKGALTAEALAELRRELIRDALGAEAIHTAIAAQVTEDLQLGRAIRDRAALVLGHVEASDLGSAALAARALAALSTAAKNTSDMLRHSLQPHQQPVAEDLPTLIIDSMTPGEVAALRERQDREEGGFDVADEPTDADAPEGGASLPS
jgi:lambda repressor-like predicted transcriptional regulator